MILPTPRRGSRKKGILFRGLSPPATLLRSFGPEKRPGRASNHELRSARLAFCRRRHPQSRTTASGLRVAPGTRRARGRARTRTRLASKPCHPRPSRSRLCFSSVFSIRSPVLGLRPSSFPRQVRLLGVGGQGRVKEPDRISHKGHRGHKGIVKTKEWFSQRSLCPLWRVFFRL